MKKGFTLVELLAVIVLIGLLSLIAIPVVDKLIKDSEEQLYQTQIDNIEAAARNYYADNIFALPENNGEYIDKTICDLERTGFLDVDIKNPKTDQLFYKDSYVRITKTNYGFEYKYIEDSGSSYSCSICVAVNEETKTTGNIPTGEYKIGDEYICEVKNGTKYNFFVLSSENEKISLIMDSNINAEGIPIKSKDVENKNVDWISQNDIDNLGNINDDVKEMNRCKEKNICTDNTKGPVTALSFLHNATKDWENVSNININYTDEGKAKSSEEYKKFGYDGIYTNGNKTSIKDNNGKITATYKNLKTRLPKTQELIDAGCEFSVNNSCPIWLNKYIYDYNDSGYEFAEIYGYWSLSSAYDSAGSADVIRFKKSLGWDGVNFGTDMDTSEPYISKTFGVRPVITVLKEELSN